MKTIRKMLLTMLLATPVVTAGELVWIEEDGTTVEPASLLNEAVRESHLGFPDDDNGPGTLMIWRNSDGNGGGPDLQAPWSPTGRISPRPPRPSAEAWCNWKPATPS